jgi:hypothetical protein
MAPDSKITSTTASLDEMTKRIDRLMAGPVKERPAIVVFGDDDLVGFTPAPPPGSGAGS